MNADLSWSSRVSYQLLLFSPEKERDSRNEEISERVKIRRHGIPESEYSKETPCRGIGGSETTDATAAIVPSRADDKAVSVSLILIEDRIEQQKTVRMARKRIRLFMTTVPPENLAFMIAHFLRLSSFLFFQSAELLSYFIKTHSTCQH